MTIATPGQLTGSWTLHSPEAISHKCPAVRFRTSTRWVWATTITTTTITSMEWWTTLGPLMDSFHPLMASFHPLMDSFHPLMASFHPLMDSFHHPMDSFRAQTSSFLSWIAVSRTLTMVSKIFQTASRADSWIRCQEAQWMEPGLPITSPVHGGENRKQCFTTYIWF